MKKPTYANLKYQLKERNTQSNQYHDNWIKEMSEVNKLKLKLNEAHDEIKKLFVEKETLRTCLIELLKHR